MNYIYILKYITTKFTMKDFYPCDKKELKRILGILDENKYFEKTGNSWNNIIYGKYCSHISRKGTICCTKIMKEGNIYCKHHLHKDIITLCSYKSCKNKCKHYGEFCHKHKCYNFNNINQIEEDIFKINIFRKYNKINEWERYRRWYNYFKKTDALFNKRIVIKDYIKDSNYNNYSSFTLIKFFNLNKYIINKIIEFHKYFENYCLLNKIDHKYIYVFLYLFYKFYETSYFRNSNKNRIYIPYIKDLNKIIIKDVYIYEYKNKCKRLIEYPIDILYNIKKDKESHKKEITKFEIKDNKKKKKNKNKTIEHLYNIFNDKIKNFITFGRFTKSELKDIKKIINNNLNNYKLKYKDNTNYYIYSSSINIFNEIENYINKNIFHDIDHFNKLTLNVFIKYKIFTLMVDLNTSEKEKEKWKPRLEEFILHKLNNF